MSYEKTLVICRCEEITYGHLYTTAVNHQCTARELKLRTRAGMGFCGGRTCRILIDRMIEDILPLSEIGDLPLKIQPPVRPVTFGTVGEQND